jgi:hypothetical protein
MNQTETLQRFIWGFMLSGEAAREAPASGGASPYRAGVNAGSRRTLNAERQWPRTLRSRNPISGLVLPPDLSGTKMSFSSNLQALARGVLFTPDS